MKTDFLQPRFAGARFDQQTLPVEVARDLAAYEELVVELAKHLYLTRNAGRKRVPKGFEQEFSLHLERVDGGSARPLLSWVAAVGFLVPGGGHSPLFEAARDVIAECVSAVAEEKPLPQTFPPHLLEYFNVLGRSLRAGESVDLAAENAPSRSVLTPERRKKLVLAAQKTYLRELDLTGLIEEVDYTKQTFRLRLDDGAAVIAAFSAASETRVREAAGFGRTRVFFRGLGAFDAYDKLQKVNATEHLEVSPNHGLVPALESLAALRDGWLDGAGVAPAQEPLEWLTDQLLSTFPADVPFPFACATPTGGVFLEWTKGDWIVSAEFPLPERRVELQAVHIPSKETTDAEVALPEAGAFSSVYAFVRRFA